ncbi:MAG: class I SAM-dependent methyltransferase [Candidatus Heimdallarchaeaceae archaeon]
MSITFEIIGHIMIIRSFSNKHELYYFAEEQLRKRKYIKTIAIQQEKVRGIERVPKLEFFMGENNFETTHTEYGNKYLLDPSKMFFSPRLSYERQRIARNIQDGEIILNFFSGVGPFSISIAKHNPKSIIHSIEINPEAYRYMLQNINLNKCQNQVIPYLGDAFEIVPRQFFNKCDRILLPLPLKADESLPLACKSLRQGKGIVHFQITEYVGNKRSKEELYELAEKRLAKIKETTTHSYETKIELVRVIRSLSSNISHIAIDIKINS